MVWVQVRPEENNLAERDFGGGNRPLDPVVLKPGSEFRGAILLRKLQVPIFGVIFG